jgi:16S rRNA C967 or C1407 C5-methylase (RsmB/RsmF family)
MANFALVTIKATVATGNVLLPVDQVDKAVDELQENLKRLGLDVLSVERVHATAKSPEPLDDDDPWSFRGQSSA